MLITITYARRKIVQTRTKEEYYIYIYINKLHGKMDEVILNKLNEFSVVIILVSTLNQIIFKGSMERAS